MRQPLVVILGPTAVGKTKLGVELALKFHGEIISGDSMQVYRHLNIGTAKISSEEMQGIPHHLLSIKEPDETFSVAEFQKLAEYKIKDIYSRNKLPIIVGGTGLYIQALIDSYDFNDQEDISKYRNKLFTIAAEKGNKYLYLLLADIDPKAADKIHVNDLKRITRALEYYELTGKRISENIIDTSKPCKYNTLLIGLNMDRQKLYDRINLRVDKMLEDGLVAEVETLLSAGYSPESPAMQGLGYKQIAAYLHGQYSLSEAVELIKRNTRHFAKRQMTWFRRDPRIQWFNTDRYTKYQELLDEIAILVGRTIYNDVE